MIDRRRLLGLGTAAALGPGLPSLGAGAAIPSNSGIRRHVTLGRTRLEVSDIGFGSASSMTPIWCAMPWIAASAFFDTAESYRFGWSEEAMGEGLRVVRDRVVLSSKTKVGARDTQEEMMAALGRRPAPPADRLPGHLLQSRGQQRCAPAEPGMAGVHRTRQGAGQDPLLRHVRTRRSARGMPGVRDRPRSGRCRAGRLQLRPGSRLRSPAPHLPFRSPAAGAAPRPRQGQGEGCRRRGDEDV